MKCVHATSLHRISGNSAVRCPTVMAILSLRVKDRFAALVAGFDQFGAAENAKKLLFCNV